MPLSRGAVRLTLDLLPVEASSSRGKSPAVMQSQKSWPHTCTCEQKLASKAQPARVEKMSDLRPDL